MARKKRHKEKQLKRRAHRYEKHREPHNVFIEVSQVDSDTRSLNEFGSQVAHREKNVNCCISVVFLCPSFRQ